MVTIVTLCIAIGANTAIFSVLHAVLLRKLPYASPERLVEIGPVNRGGVQSLLYPDYEQLRERDGSIEEFAVHFQNTGVSRITVTSGDEPETMKAGFVSASFFSVLGVFPALGRVFTGDEIERREPVAVLSDPIWRRRFAASPGVIGESIRVNGLGYRIVGVMPPSFAYPDPDSAIWVPITLNREWARRGGPVPFFRVFGRLRGGVDPAAAAFQLGTLPSDGRITVGVAPFRPKLPEQLRAGLYFLSGAVGFLLLIACANIANLTLARGQSREGEIALRMALGASRHRVAAEMFADSLILAVSGALAGLAVASFGADLLARFGPPGLPRIEETSIDGAVMLFCAAATLLASVLFGLLPAWKLAGRDPIQAMRGLDRGASSGSAGARLRSALATAELALSVLLLAGAGLMLRSLHAAQNVDPGFEPSHALVLRVLFPDGTPFNRTQEYHERLFERLEAVAGVRAAGAIDDLWAVREPGVMGLRSVEGKAAEPRDQWTPLTWNTAGGRFLDAMGATLIRGRWFNDQDDANAPLVVVIDESMARRYWPGEDPIGRRFKGQDARGKNDDWLTVIGVVKNMRRAGLEREPTPHVYEWRRQSRNALRYVVVRTAGDPARLTGDVRSVARGLDAMAILSPVQTMDSELDTQLSNRRFQTVLVTLFAGIGIVLAGVGLFGVVNYSVIGRMREFGVRMVLGESPAGLRRRVMVESLRLAAMGIIAGLAGVLGLSRVLGALLFGVMPLDAIALGSAILFLVMVTLIAAVLPAWRAARIQPIEVLRGQ